jgi:hypothetical protein
VPSLLRQCRPKSKSRLRRPSWDPALQTGSCRVHVMFDPLTSDLIWQSEALALNNTMRTVCFTSRYKMLSNACSNLRSSEMCLPLFVLSVSKQSCTLAQFIQQPAAKGNGGGEATQVLALEKIHESQGKIKST